MPDLKKDSDPYDWIETVVRVSKAVGMNPIRVRWKLRAWQNGLENRKRLMQSRAEAVVHKHKTCPKCRAINSLDETVCSKCGAKLHSREVEVVNRFLGHFYIGLSVESFLALAFFVVYGLEVFRGHNSQWLYINSFDLIAMGGNSPIGIVQFSYPSPDLWIYIATRGYTLLTAVFLHAGLLHLAFNAYSLMYVAPVSRQVFNSGKVIFVFLVSGVAASLASLVWRMNVVHSQWFVGIGASGALCGLIGLMLVWGHRDGTFSGRLIRNQMARWTGYLLVYGFFLRADNIAHIGGLIAGGVIGYLLPADFHRPESSAWKAIEALAWLIVIAAVGLIAYLTLTTPLTPTHQ